MTRDTLYGPIKGLALLVLLLMLVALLYAAGISITHWAGIGV
ncbi:MAG: hypothetical protein QM742_09115 [Aquabacterium sp.]